MLAITVIIIMLFSTLAIHPHSPLTSRSLSLQLPSLQLHRCWTEHLSSPQMANRATKQALVRRSHKSTMLHDIILASLISPVVAFKCKFPFLAPCNACLSFSRLVTRLSTHFSVPFVSTSLRLAEAVVSVTLYVGYFQWPSVQCWQTAAKISRQLDNYICIVKTRWKCRLPNAKPCKHD